MTDINIRGSWDDLYRNSPVNKLPWYTKELDFDLKKELKKLEIRKGSFLDLGTGPGTQAIALSKLGFDVTGTDISRSAINKLKKQKSTVIFFKDDILKTKIKKKFDYILDRGIFHVFEPKLRKTYIKKVKKLLNTNGILFLKCFSIKEKNKEGPYRFSKKQIKNYFNTDFKVKIIKDSVFHSTLDKDPKALFVVMEKK